VWFVWVFRFGVFVRGCFSFGEAGGVLLFMFGGWVIVFLGGVLGVDGGGFCCLGFGLVCWGCGHSVLVCCDLYLVCWFFWVLFLCLVFWWVCVVLSVFVWSCLSGWFVCMGNVVFWLDFVWCGVGFVFCLFCCVGCG